MSGSDDSFTKLEIQGIFFKLPRRYSAGHMLTPAEAVALDRIRADNIRNIFTKTVKEAKEGDSLEELFQTFAEDYEFTRLTPKSSLDPVEKSAYSIASGLVNDLLRQRNITKTSLANGKFEEMVQKVLESNPDIYDEARSRIAISQRLAEHLL